MARDVFADGILDLYEVFSGIVYESVRQHHGGNPPQCNVTAYSELILYDKHLVFRSYPTGTKAGAIIRDLASLESNVNTSNVDDGPSLTSPWQIENMVALKIMQDVARGTNYWLRMKPGRVLYFKPKTTGSPVATLDSSKVISADYTEDRWRLKNRVIYVGANGRVLADVSEGAGDLPIVVHDPFLTDGAEAARRANIRLALNKEYGRQLRVVMHRTHFESMDVDLGSTIRVNLPSLGLNDVDMYLVGMECDPQSLQYTLTLGGRLELLEDFLDEAIGGDVAGRFGPSVSVAGEVSTMRSNLFFTQKIISITSHRYVTYLNRPPLTIHGGQNVTIRTDTGEVELASGFTTGHCTISFLPPTETFRRWGYVEWVSFMNQGSVRVRLLDTSGNELASKDDRGSGPSLTKRLPLKKWPGRPQEFTRHPAIRNWGSTNTANASTSFAGVISGSCIRLAPSTSGTMGEIFYNKTKNLGLNLSWARYMSVFFLAFVANTTVKIRLHTNANNYFEATVPIVEAGRWREYVIYMSTLSSSGSPNMSNINWISILADYPILIDSDYVFHQYPRGELRVRFELSRPNASAVSPKIRRVVITYEEVVV
ncbi:MAG: hypothetical protein NZ920_01265 [Aigarchaeota archaeon]|nr:hypothetical protein [Aigarchaeota archaeon]MDW8093071.1 hypothetical protein [Nitrososphaerota archaeon]